MQFLSAFALLLLPTMAIASASASEPIKIYLTAVRSVSNIVQSGNKVWVSSRFGTWRQLILASNLMDTVKGPSPKAITVYDPNKLPDTEITPRTNNIQSAWIARPTDQYDHGVLEDSIEAGALKAKLIDGKTLELVLPKMPFLKNRYQGFSILMEMADQK